MIPTRRRGSPTRSAIEVAAVGSVGDTIAPSTNAVGQSSPGIIACATAATTTVVASTSPTASSEISAMFARTSRSEVKYAPA